MAKKTRKPDKVSKLIRLMGALERVTLAVAKLLKVATASPYLEIGLAVAALLGVLAVRL